MEYNDEFLKKMVQVGTLGYPLSKIINVLDIDNEKQFQKDFDNPKHEAAIPELTKEWIEKGNQILDEKYRETWAKCVPIRLGDLYQGMELQMCLDIVLELNNGCTLDKAK